MAAQPPSSSSLWTSSQIQMFTPDSFPLILIMAQTLYVLPAGITHKKGKTLLPGDELGEYGSLGGSSFPFEHIYHGIICIAQTVPLVNNNSNNNKKHFIILESCLNLSGVTHG